MEKTLSVLVIANRRKPLAKKMKAEIGRFLISNNARLCGAKGKPGLVVSVGGDGTVLFGKRHYGIPYFAIGSKTSFLCQSDFSNWKLRLSRAISRLRFDRRLLLEGRLDGMPLPLALNEIGIRNPQPRILSIHLHSGKRHYAFRADGVLFSTPTGSPAYCYSCGGREMEPSDSRYQAVAISPFRRLFSPKVFPKGTTCTIRISGGERAQLFIDGQPFGAFTPKNVLRVKGSKIQFLFAKYD